MEIMQHNKQVGVQYATQKHLHFIMSTPVALDRITPNDKPRKMMQEAFKIKD
jgi:hypothetical protein